MSRGTGGLGTLVSLATGPGVPVPPIIDRQTEPLTAIEITLATSRRGPLAPLALGVVVGDAQNFPSIGKSTLRVDSVAIGPSRLRGLRLRTCFSLLFRTAMSNGLRMKASAPA